MNITELNNENFEMEVLQSEKPVLIDFWASWCGPCRMMSPVVDNIAETMGDKVKVCKVNIDENQELAEKYEVMTIPTFLVIKNGKETGRTIGVQPKEDILKLI
ncbi:MAG: thioredoxin [Clostridia bacterium]